VIFFYSLKEKERTKIIEDINTECEENENVLFILFTMKLLQKDYSKLEYNAKFTQEGYFLSYINQMFPTDDTIQKIEDFKIKYFFENLNNIYRSIFPLFSLQGKEDLIRIVISILKSENRNHEITRLIPYLPALGIEPIEEFVLIIKKGLADKDKLCYQGIINITAMNQIPVEDFPINPWTKPFIEAMQNFDNEEENNA